MQKAARRPPFVVKGFCSAAEQSAHHAAEEGAGAATAAAVIMTAAASATAVTAGLARRLVVGVVAGSGGHTGRQDFGLQRLVLQRVEVAALRIAAGGLPAGDHGAGVVVELAGNLGVEAEAGQAALHVAALAAIEAELVLGGLIGFVREGGRIDADARGQVP